MIAARDAAVEERSVMFGPTYTSALEGYGDMSRELLNIQDGVKALKKGVAEVVAYVGAQDVQELHKSLILMEGKASSVAYEALRMMAVIKRFQETVRIQSGGDLLDLLEDEDD